MEAKAKLVKDLITGLDLSKEEALEVIVFITAQSGVSFFDFPAVREGMFSIKDLMQVQNEFLQRLLETIGKEADAENIGTDTGSRTEKTAAGETEQAPAVEEAALLPTSEESVETIAEAKPKRKYTRRKGVEKKTEKKSVHPKGYSVNGRKLGRPRKVNSVNEMEAYAPNAVLLKEGNASAKIEGKDAVTEEAKAEVVGTTAFETPFPTEMPLEKEDGAAVSETVPENSAETEVQEEPALRAKKNGV